MLKAKESKTASTSGAGGRRKKQNTHVRFFLPSSPSSSSPVHGGIIADPSSPSPSPSSASSYVPSRFASSSFSTSSSLASSSSFASTSSSSSGGPPRRPPPLAPSTLRSLTSSSPSSSSSSLPSSAPATSSRSTLSSSTSSAPSSRVRLPPSSFSYLAPASSLSSSSSSSSASSALHRRTSTGPGSSSSSASSSSAFFVPPPRPAVAPASAFTSSSSFASLPGSRGWNRYRSALDRAAVTTGGVAGAAQPPARRPSPTPPTWRDDTDVSCDSDSDSDGGDHVDDHGRADVGLSARHASTADTSGHSSANAEGDAAFGLASGQSSPSSFSIESLPSLSSPTSSLGTSSPTRSAVTPAAATTVRRPSLPPPPPAAPRPSFGCARPFAGVTDAESVADALRAWLIPGPDDNASVRCPKAKTTKVRLGVEVGRLREAPRCSVRVAHLTGTEGRKARQWAEVGHNSVAISVAFVVKDGVDVFELGELSGSIKNLLLLAGSDEIDTTLESKLVEEGPDASKILLLNVLFRDACLFDALSAVLAHHRVEQAEASLLLSHGPGDCRVRRARNDGVDARLTVDAVLGRSVLRFVEEFLANRQREAAAREKERSEDESENEAADQQRRRSSVRPRRATREEKRRAAGALFRRYGRQLLGLELPAGLRYEDRAARLVFLLRALNDLRFFVEFDSLDALLQRLWPGDADDVDTNSGDNDESEDKKKSKKKEKGKEEPKKKKKKKHTKEKKDKRMSADSKRLDRERRESKTKSADAPRVRRGTAGPDAITGGHADDDDSGNNKKDDIAGSGGVRRNNWHALHEYLCASYGQLVAQTVARAADNGDDDGDGDAEEADLGAEARREIEEGIVTSVRDMLIRLQSLCAVHSLRFIVGDHVLHVACEGLALFDVLPSRDEMATIERRARREHRKKKKNSEKMKQHSANRKAQKADVEPASGKPSSSGSKNAKHEPPPGSRRDDVSSRDEVVTSAAAPSLRPTPPPKRDKASIKVMVLGDLRVGKTSLIQRFMKGAAFVLPAKYKPTYAADFVHKNVTLLGKPRTLQIWDTSGNERQRAPDRAFFKGVDVLVLVFDQRRASTFVHALDRHLDDFLAHAACPDPRRLPVVVVGNHGGEAVEAGERAVTRGEVEAWCRDRIDGNRHFVYFEANAKDGANVDAAFLHAAHAVLDLYHQSG